MTDTIILTEIKSYLSRLKTEVTISNSSNETDINIHAENLIRRVLSTLFDCEILNAGKSIKKNNESFDLFDTNGHYAFQVTSTNINRKILGSIFSFIKYSWQEKYKELFLILIGYDKKQYNKATINKILDLTNNKFLFTVSKNIIDLNDLYQLIVETNSTITYIKIRDILKEQFDIITSTGNIKNELVVFFDEYKENVKIKYRRINFFGLDVSSKPSEVDLESIFIHPFFKKHGNVFSSKNYIIDRNYFFENTEFESSFAKHILLDGSINLLTDMESNIHKVYRTSALKDYLYSVDNSSLKFDSQPNSIYNFFSFVDRTVILGKAGAGKSSLTKYITLKLLNKSTDIFSNDESLDYIPFRIQLFQYNQEKKVNGDSLQIYLLKYLQKEIAVKNISILLLNHILEKVNCLVFFDGLDEIFDIQDRLNVRDDIEVFAKNHSKCKIVITSRFESNTEVPFDVNTFSVYEVEGFNNDQINTYIEKWYSVVEKEEIYKDEEVDKFKIELKKIDVELIENPLLLSLILIIYKNERELPTSKFDIYKGCTNTIVETRDKKEKRINYSTAVLNKIGVFSSLAYWQFSLENRDRKPIHNNDVIKFLTIELHSDFGDIDIAERAAKEFIEFAKIRSIYFENSFTHKTFSEYFTSHYIYTEFFWYSDNSCG